VSSMSFYDNDQKIWIKDYSDIRRHAALMCQRYWSPHIFRGGVKSEENWISSDYIVVGFSIDDVKLSAIRSAAKNTTHVLASSQDRFIILVVQLSKTIKSHTEYLSARTSLLQLLPPESPPSTSPAFYSPIHAVEAQISRKYQP
jgi:hypothetical protein